MKAGKRLEHVSTRSRIEKLGPKEDTDVLLLGIEEDTAFVEELGGEVRRSRREEAGEPETSSIIAARSMK